MASKSQSTGAPVGETKEEKIEELKKKINELVDELERLKADGST